MVGLYIIIHLGNLFWSIVEVIPVLIYFFGGRYMKLISQPDSLKLKTLLVTLATAVLLPACAQVSSQEQPPIKIDGSSTVAPITQAVVEQLKAEKPNQDVKVEANISGTRGGFQQFCAGETDINAASRPILREEMEACNQKEVRYVELPIAFDALTVVVNPKNTWVDSLKVEELKTIWQPEAEGKIKNWKQVRPSFPNNPLTLYGPGKDSGTFDYFTEAIVGQEDASRQDYVFSENDDVLVNGVSQDPNALGYFGYAYYEKNADKLKAVPIDSGKGAILPSRETVETAQYQPLTRPLFIYVNAKKAQDNPALEQFVEYYLEKAPALVSQVGYIPLPEEGYHLGQIHFQRLKVGTVFGGKSKFNLTIGELLRKQAQFDVTEK
jgi:phosphate transport system substrate-binding protein